MKILVVDDEKPLVKGIKFNLENEGYEVSACYDGEEAVAAVRSGDFDLVVLDVMMPRLDGLGACMQIRTFSSVPILMLTARSEDMDKLIGFEYGADDYLTKPFNILELKARIKALLRRSGAEGAYGRAQEMITAGHIRLNPALHMAYKNEEPVELRMKEYDLALLLMRNPGKVYSRDNLLDLVWGRDYQGDARTVDVHIRRLREKLELDPAEPEYFLTRWGVGYYFKEP